MRNDPFVFEIYQHRITSKKKRTLTEMRPLVICCHSLSLVVIPCHFINDPRKISKDQKKTFACALQKECSDEIVNVQGKCGILLQQT